MTKGLELQIILVKAIIFCVLVILSDCTQLATFSALVGTGDKGTYNTT